MFSRLKFTVLSRPLASGRLLQSQSKISRRLHRRCVTRAALSLNKTKGSYRLNSAAARGQVVPFSLTGLPEQHPAVTAQRPALLPWFTGLWRQYLQALVDRPLLTKAATCFGGQVLGDLIAQAATTHSFRDAGFDLHRSLVLSSFAALVGGPAGHIWHRFLDSRVCSDQPTSSKAVAGKLVLDQAAMCPIMNSIFAAWLHFFMFGGTPGGLLPFVGTTLPTLLAANWRVWPVANVVAFKWVPQDLRILYQNSLGVAWGTYISCLSVGTIA